MFTKPKISVIMPSLNVAPYIKNCIESVINQTIKNIEIICVDAGSTDGTLEVLREYEKKDSRIKVILSNKKSYGYQMNLGIDIAKGEYLGIVETDDFISSEMYEELYTIAKEKKLDFIKADFYRFTVSPNEIIRNYNKLSKNEKYYNRILKPSEELKTFYFPMNTWSGIYSLDFIRRNKIRHNETPGASYQDNGFWFQTFCLAERAYFVNKPYYMNRRDNPNSSVYSKSKVYCMKEEYDFIRRFIENDWNKLKKFIPLCNYFRFCGYYYNTIDRISDEYIQEFLYNFSNEFQRLLDNSELDKDLFSENEWNVLTQIIYDPYGYYLDNFLPHFKQKSSSILYMQKEKSSPLISVIVPVYNVEKYLSECLDSILNQTFKDFEVICINDGSTDRSLEILETYKAKDERLKIYNQQNSGSAAARNTGLSLATGKYICFVDSDDGLDLNALQIIYNNAEANSADIVVFGIYAQYYSDNGNVPVEKINWIESKNPKRNIVYNNFEPYILFNEQGAKPFVWRNCYKREFLKNNNISFWSDCLFGEDLVFQFEAFPKASNIVFIVDKLYYYRCYRPDSLMAVYNKNLIKKTNYHIQIVSYLRRKWEENRIMDKMQKEFTTWAVNYVYDCMIPLKDTNKESFYEAAKDLLCVLSGFIGEKQLETLGPGTRERILELKEVCHNIEETVINNIIDKEFVEHEPCKNPKISFIVPVYNMVRYIERCLYSLLSQTLEDIEVICVDDCSTDGTGELLQKISKIDKRLTVISYTENKTANQARKDAVLASKGEYILFCDADDTYEINACEMLYKEMKSQPVDILQFGTNVINCRGSEEDKNYLEKYLLPHFGSLEGEDVFLGCFRYRLYSFTLWNKMYSATLCKKAFSRIKDGKFPRGQDKYAFTVLAYYASSYRGVSGLRLYNYHLALGIDGRLSITLGDFKKFCSFSLVSDAIKEFFEEEGILNKYFDIWISSRNQLIGDCVNKWDNKVRPEDKGKCFDILLNSWPKYLIIESIARRNWDKQEQVVENLKNSQLYSITKKNPKVIGTYYHKLKNGGVERLLESLIPLWMSMGYKVVVITDDQGYKDNVVLPKGVKRYMIPNNGINMPNLYKYRAQCLNEIIEKECIDMMIYHAWNTSILLWDMLISKSAGASFVIHCHSIFSLRLRQGQPYFSMKPIIYSFSDAIVCLSDVDKAFWSNFNKNTFDVMNPPAFRVENEKCADLDGKNVLWIGRFSPEKRPEDAIQIFARVSFDIPDAKLQIVGSADSRSYLEKLKELCLNLGIEKKVEFYGYRDDVKQFYKKASVLLVTSEFEGFSMVLLEGKIFGLPIVMYELPYITLARENKGILSAKFGDISNAAILLKTLLENTELRKKIGMDGRYHAQELAKYDYSSVWQEIFDSLSEKRTEPKLDVATKLMWKTLLNHYAIGVESIKNKSNIG